MWKVHRGILSSYMMDREIGTWKVGNRNENHIINEMFVKVKPRAFH